MTAKNRKPRRAPAQADGSAERADQIAYLERVLANAQTVQGNSAASNDARAMAASWTELLFYLLELAVLFPDQDPAAKLVHWAQLTQRLTGELRGGLHLGEAAAQALLAAQGDGA